MTAARRLRSVGPDPAGRAVLYVRVSALMGREGADFHSPELQLAAMRRGAAPLGLREVATIQDIDVSGRTFSRDGLDKIRKMAEARQIDVVYVYDYSRLGRNLSEAGTFIKWLAAHNVRVVSANERVDDTSATGTFAVNMFLNMAELYSKQVGERWSDVIGRRARQQGLPHGRPRIGYIKVGRDHVKDPIIGDVVADIIRRYADGESLRPLALMLGVARGKPVDPSTVHTIVTSPFYAGKVRNNGEWFPGAHEALVSEDVHRKALSHARVASGKPPRARNPVHSISGLVWCGHCRGRAKCSGTSDEPRVYCSAASSELPKICPGFGTPSKARIENAIRASVSRWMAMLRSDPSAQLAIVGERALLLAQRSRLEQELTRTANAIGKLTAAWALDQVADDAYADGIRDLREAETATRDALDRIIIPDEAQNPATLIAIAERLDAVWGDLNDYERNRALSTLVTKAYIHRGDVRGSQTVTVEFV